MPRLVLDWAREHFDPERFADYTRWRLLYLSRHGRVADPEEMFVRRGKTSRELDAWVGKVSEMLKTEAEAARSQAKAK